MFEPKYIKTENNQMVIFPASFKHSDFSHLKPVSAGFISISINEYKLPVIKCYGESSSLDLKSAKEDTGLALKQFINYHY